MAKQKSGVFSVSLFWKILIAILIVGVLPIFLIGYTSSISIKKTGDTAQDVAVSELDSKSIEALYIRANQTVSEIEALLDLSVQDLLYASQLSPSLKAYFPFYESRTSELWYSTGSPDAPSESKSQTPIYREMAYIDANGQEIIRIVDGAIVPADGLRNVAEPANTTYKTETYFAETKSLPENEVYVSPVMAWHVTTSAQPAKAEDALTSQFAYADYDAVIRFAKPVYSDGEFAGIVVLSMDYRHIMEKTSHIYPITEEVIWPDYASGNYAYMLDYEGWVIAHPLLTILRGMDENGNLLSTWTKDTISEVLPFNMLTSDIKEEAVEISSAILAGNDGNIQSKNLEGAVKADVYIPIFFSHGVYQESGIFGGIVMSQNIQNIEKAGKISKDVIEDAVVNIQQDTVLIGSIAFIIFIITAIIVSRNIITPIRHLTEAARIMEKGELDVNIIKGLLERKIQDEVSELARVFKQMAEAVQLRERRLREEVQELKIQIDMKKKEEDVNKIVESDTFKALKEKAAEMRAQRRDK